MKQVILSIFLVVLPAAAQWRHFGPESPRATGFFGGGFTSPVNPTARQLDMGWNINGGVGVTTNYLGVMLDAIYTDMSMNHATLLRYGVPQGNQRFWAITVDPIFHVNQRGPVDFYVTGGGGLYSQITDFRAHGGYGPYGYGGPYGGPYGSYVIGEYTLYKGGVNGGAGFAFNLGYHTNIKIFTEARFHHMFINGSGANFIPVSVGVRF